MKKVSYNLILHQSSARIVLLALLIAAEFVSCSREVPKVKMLRSDIDAADTLQLRSLEGTGVFVDGWVGDAARFGLGNAGHWRVLSVAGTNVQTGMKDERLVLKIEFASGKAEQIGVPSTGAFEQMLLIPAADASQDTLTFRMTSAKTFVPSHLGTSKDDRKLSFHLSKIALIDPSSLAQKMPESFEFPRQADTEPNLAGIYRDGWIGDSATITLFNVRGKKTVEIRGFAPPDVFDKVATLESSVNGALLVKEQISKQAQGYFRSIIQIPDEYAGLVALPLTLKPSGSFVPAQRKINSDLRRISFQIQYIGLK